MSNGKLAQAAGFNRPLQVLQSGGGFYIGTSDEEGPVSRESVEYYPTREVANTALSSGNWTQRRSSLT